MANSPTTSGSFQQGNPPVGNSTSAPDLAADANAIADEAKAAFGKIADEVKHDAAGVADMAKAELAGATEKAKEIATDQKGMIAEQVSGIAGAMERAASDLEANNGVGAHYARLIADNAEKLSATVRDSSVDELLDMAQDFGRRQPVAFMSAAALLGFAASRFVLASAKRREDQSRSEDTPLASTTPTSTSASPSTNGGYSGTTGGL